jgi:hypothetical protein
MKKKQKTKKKKQNWTKIMWTIETDI